VPELLAVRAQLVEQEIPRIAHDGEELHERVLAQDLRGNARVVAADQHDVRVHLSYRRRERRSHRCLDERDSTLVRKVVLNELSRHLVQADE
jgi:hypothetical protein